MPQPHSFAIPLLYDPSHTKTQGDEAVLRHFQDSLPRPRDQEEVEDVCIVHVKAGSEHQALLYLLRSVSRHFQMDDVLPEPPPHIASHRYIVLRSPQGNCKHAQWSHAHMHACSHACSHAPTHAHTHARTHAPTHERTRARTNPRTLARSRARTHAHTHTHTHRSLS